MTSFFAKVNSMQKNKRERGCLKVHSKFEKYLISGDLLYIN